MGMLEARVGIEPTHKGFADLSLTTWVPRPKEPWRVTSNQWLAQRSNPLVPASCPSLVIRHLSLNLWSGKWDSNPRLRPWQGRTLPLSYSRSPVLNNLSPQHKVDYRNARTALSSQSQRFPFAAWQRRVCLSHAPPQAPTTTHSHPRSRSALLAKEPTDKLPKAFLMQFQAF
jgi:hypothetical protein